MRRRSVFEVCLVLAVLGCGSDGVQGNRVPPQADADLGSGGGGGQAGHGDAAAGGRDAAEAGGREAPGDSAPPAEGGTGPDGASPDSSDPDGGPSTDLPPPAPGAGRWETLAPRLPAGPRQEVGVAVVDGLVFVVGGLQGSGRRVEAFDPRAGTWQTHLDLPVAVDHGNVAAVGGKLYVVGGSGLGRVLEYDPSLPADQRQWVDRGPMPVPRSAAAVGVVGATIYVAGGSAAGQGTVTELSAFDTAAGSFKTSSRMDLTALPAPGRNHVPGAVVDGIFYVLGGRTGATTTVRDEVDAYDPATDTWTRKAALPTPRAGSAAGALGGRIYVAGGEGNTKNPRGIFPETEAYDPGTDSWTKLADMETPRHGFGAGVVDGKIYFPAGGTSQGGGSPVAIVEVFIP